ncbi:hypothetical protein Tco_1178355, partial [Tanacetum coccineum]
MNKTRKVRSQEPKESTSNTPTQADSQTSKITNKPLLTFTGMKCSTSASGSKPRSNTKKNRISQAASSNQKNKVEDHPRSVKSCLNKKNRVYECTCVVDYLMNVNRHAKS